MKIEDSRLISGYAFCVLEINYGDYANSIILRKFDSIYQHENDQLCLKTTHNFVLHFNKIALVIVDILLLHKSVFFINERRSFAWLIFFSRLRQRRQDEVAHLSQMIHLLFSNKLHTTQMK